MNNHENFILEFLSSIAIQCSTSVIREIFIQEAAKFTNPRKFLPSKILGSTVTNTVECPSSKLIVGKGVHITEQDVKSTTVNRNIHIQYSTHVISH